MTITEIPAVYEKLAWSDPKATREKPGSIRIVCSPPLEGGQESLFASKAMFQIWLRGTNPDELDVGLTYRFYGKYTSYRNKHTGQTEQQFSAESFCLVKPHGQRGIVRYLRRAKNIGNVRALRLWEHFRGDAVRILREHPESAAKVLKLNPDELKEAAAFLKEQQGIEDCTIEVTDLLSGRHFPKTLRERVIKKWGNAAPEKIRRNPFRLLEFSGCGYGLCDAMYQDLGHDPGGMVRQAMCVWNLLLRDGSGSVWFSTEFIESGLRREIGSAVVQPVRAVRAARWLKLIATTRDETGRVWVALRQQADDEQYLARELARKMTEAGDWPDPADIDGITDHQRAELRKALQARIGLFSGRPGTGKTYTLARLVGHLQQEHGEENVLCVALTNAAVNQLRKTFQAYGLEHVRAATIASAVGAKPDSSGNWTYARNAGNPLDCRYLIIDEISMSGASGLARLFRAADQSCHMLEIGDPVQLPSVEPGAVLRDSLAMGIPAGELTVPMRNGGRAQLADTTLRETRRFTVSPQADPANGENLVLLPARPEQIGTRVVQLAARIKERGLCDPIRDFQVIVPTNSGRECARVELSLALQDVLNPTGKSVPGCPWRVGDKIVCRERTVVKLLDVLDEDAASDLDDDAGHTTETSIAKGAMGYVESIGEKTTVLEFLAPACRVAIPTASIRPELDGGKVRSVGLTLGYALTCHYMQGSEAKVVAVALDASRGARSIYSLEWLITAISRMKEMCFLVGAKSTADTMARRQQSAARKTFLLERCHEELRTCGDRREGRSVAGCSG